MTNKALAFKYKIKRKKDQILDSKFLLAVLMLTIGISWTVTYYEYPILRNDYNKAIEIVNRIENSGEVVKKTDDSVGAATQANSTSEEELNSPSPARELTVEMSAYTSRVEETDASPCISADGSNICEYDGCVVAYNALPLGSKVIVDGFGECTVKDRMNSRYGENNMDIYFKHDLQGALAFGRQQVNVTVL